MGSPSQDVSPQGGGVVIIMVSFPEQALSELTSTKLRQRWRCVPSPSKGCLQDPSDDSAAAGSLLVPGEATGVLRLSSKENI